MDNIKVGYCEKHEHYWNVYCTDCYFENQNKIDKNMKPSDLRTALQAANEKLAKADRLADVAEEYSSLYGPRIGHVADRLRKELKAYRGGQSE